MFFLGSYHGRDAQSVEGPKPPHFFWTRTSIRLFFMMDHCLGYCFWGLGHGHDTRSVRGAKAPLILLEKKKKTWHGRRSNYSQQRAAIRAIVFFLGLGNGCNAWSVGGNQPPRILLGLIFVWHRGQFLTTRRGAAIRANVF
jgi:hypothetical protein